MHEHAERLAGAFLGKDEPLEREFEARLAAASTLAVRVAYGALRHRQDAEDVAQEAFVKAYRRFGDLRDRERFRAWLVRMTWRLAIDRQRGDRRPAARGAGADHSTNHDERRYEPPAALEDLAARERADRLWAAIDALPDKLR